jgi:hypothetical protein
MIHHPEMDADYEEQWEFTYECARGDTAEPEPKPVSKARQWPKAVSIAQAEWAKRQLQYFDAGGKIDQPRGALEALATTDPEGLPSRASDLHKPAKPTAKPGKAKRAVNKR